MVNHLFCLKIHTFWVLIPTDTQRHEISLIRVRVLRLGHSAVPVGSSREARISGSVRKWANGELDCIDEHTETYEGKYFIFW
jgi:hypothetical protein